MFDWLKTGKATEPRKGMPSPQLDEAEFKRRFLAQFNDPCFDTLAAELARVGDTAWDAYINSRKAPRTRKAGVGYADPDYELGKARRQVCSASRSFGAAGEVTRRSWCRRTVIAAISRDAFRISLDPGNASARGDNSKPKSG